MRLIDEFFGATAAIVSIAISPSPIFFSCGMVRCSFRANA
jgi:hypothetical protein